jgi:hypothetical protein
MLPGKSAIRTLVRLIRERNARPKKFDRASPALIHLHIRAGEAQRAVGCCHAANTIESPNDVTPGKSETLIRSIFEGASADRR